MRIGLLPLCLLVSLSSCIISVGGGSSSSDVAALCKDKSSFRTGADATADQRIDAGLCMARFSDPAKRFRDWDGVDLLEASLIVVLCDTRVQEGTDEGCARGLGALISHDLAEAVSPQALSTELGKLGASQDRAKAYQARYEEAHKAALSRGLSPGSDRQARIYHGMRNELRKLAEKTQQERATIAKLGPELEQALQGSEGDAELLASASAARDAFVARCVAETRLSTGVCWHGTAARPLTEQIAKLADLTGDGMASYLEWDTLEQEADLRAPAAQLYRAMQGKDLNSSWDKWVEPRSVRSRDERTSAQKNVEFIGEAVLKVTTQGDQATLRWKTRVSSSTSMSCGAPRLVVTKSGRLGVHRPCRPSQHETTRHVNAPVQLPAADVQGLEPGNHAVVILPKGKRAGRLMQAGPTLEHTGRSAKWHRFRHTENRPPADGLP